MHKGNCIECSENNVDIIGHRLCSACYNVWYRNKKSPTTRRTVSCLECGRAMVRLYEHLLQKHHMTKEHYLTKHPNGALSIELVGTQAQDKESLRKRIEKVNDILNNTKRGQKIREQNGRKWFQKVYGHLTHEEKKEFYASFKRNPDKSRETIKKTIASGKIKYCDICGQSMSASHHCPTFEKRSAIAKETHKNHPGLLKKKHYAGVAKHPDLYGLGGKASMQKLAKNRPFIVDGTHFLSKSEIKVAELLVSRPFIKNVNVGVDVAGIGIDGKPHHITIDFYPQQKVFVEYHPTDYRKNRSPEQYAKERKVILNSSKYVGVPIEFIFEDILKEHQKVIEEIWQIKKKYDL